jgi:hypothetical protein
MILNVHSAVQFCMLVGILFYASTLQFHYVTGLSASSLRPSSSTVERRTFMSRISFALIGVVTSTAMTTAQIHSVASAYERRDVGGPDASPETKAMNLQAYETNNRLERDGVKLEVTCFAHYL